jgi:hypothetical protein
MPRALLRDILTEKKKELPIKTEGEFYAKLNSLQSACFNVLASVTTAESLDDEEKKNTKGIRDNIEKYLVEIDQIGKDREKYLWDDESVQNLLIGSDGLESKIQKAFEETKKSRELNLGKNDSLKFANDYFKFAEEQMEKGNRIIFELASIEAQKSKAEQFRKSTDPVQQSSLDTETLDIVAKKGIEQKEGESDVDFKKRQEEQESFTKKKREGIIKVIATLLGLTEEEIQKRYTAEDAKTKLATRIKLYNEVMPLLEAISGRTYQRCEEKEGKGVFDPQFIEDLSVLAEYRGFYSEKYEKSDRPVEGEEEKPKDQFTEKDYLEIEEEAKNRRSDLESKLNAIIKDNSDPDDFKQKKLKELAEECKKELNTVELKSTCSTSNTKKMKVSKEELDSAIESYSKSLTAEDLKNLKEISEITQKILDFCDTKLGK